MSKSDDFTAQVGAEVPFLRRYGRALTGAQSTGDAYAAATLEALLTERSIAENASSVRVGLFKAFHVMWKSSGAPVADEETGMHAQAQKHLAKLTKNTREALLLSTIEEFTIPEVAEILQVPESEAEQLVSVARAEMEDSISGRVMIIEDEAIIAMDLETVVAEMGHKITGIARTRDEATKLASAERPDLILSDIQLADDSSGIDAVNDILKEHGETSIIFITAFPERLLTGDRPEPAFLISKPYSEAQIKSAVSQAMFFRSTEPLLA